MTTVEAPETGLGIEIWETLLQGHTCGEACWHAREDVCRCSCGGRNHGCLRDGNTQPDRVCRKGQYIYKLLAVLSDDKRCGIGYSEACNLVDRFIVKAWPEGNPNRPMLDYTTGKQAVRPDGRLYFYSPSADDKGIPAFARTASESQRRWPEATGYTEAPILVWARWDLITA